jgi:hypothetical protein
MPLPQSGVGETLQGNTSGARGGGAGLLRQETLFGIAPEDLMGSPAPGRTAAPSPVKPAAKPSLGRTSHGAAPPALTTERPAVSSGDRAGDAGDVAGEGTLTAGGVPLHSGSAVPHRTLLGVMPDDMVKALASVRDNAPALGRAPAPRAASGPGATKTARNQGPPPDPQPAAPAMSAEALRGGTIVGAAIPAARGATPAAPRAGAPAAAPATPRATPRAPSAQSPAARNPAPSPVRAVDAGTVRSMSADGERLAPGGSLPRNAADSETDDDPTTPDDVENGDAVQLPVHARTHLGVAIPGIAPLHAGMSIPAPATRAAPLEATQLQPDSLAAAPPLSARTAMPRGAFVLLGSGLALLLAACAFALLWRGSKPISVAISADASGKDRIDLVCEECPDGTLVSMKESRAEISGRKAYLTLSEPLPLGDNRASFALQRPGAKRPELVDLELPPVEYRIRPDTSTLGGDQPRLTLKISAIAGSKVEIARQPVALDAQGNGEIAVDLSGQLIGPASEVTTFEQAIQYSIAPPSGKVYEGELAFKIGVTPLLLEAPGVDTVTDLERFMLAGRTTRGAELWVAGTTIAVDDAGRFAQLMSIDSVGETRVTVRATEPGLAPRFASFRLQRVENLETELAARRQKAVPLAQVARAIADHVGSTVVVSGRVEEARIDGHRSLIILQADGDCGRRSCLVRLVYGGLRKLSRGENISAIGRLQGAVGAPNSTLDRGEVPEVDVSLLL